MSHRNLLSQLIEGQKKGDRNVFANKDEGENCNSVETSL